MYSQILHFKLMDQEIGVGGRLYPFLAILVMNKANMTHWKSIHGSLNKTFEFLISLIEIYFRSEVRDENVKYK